MISVICACNDTETLNTMLLPSLQKQTYTDWELIVMDAKKEGLNSAAATLNLGAERANGDILVFVHQDIELLEDDLFEKLVNYCNEYEFGVGGVAGSSKQDKCVYSSVVQGYEDEQAGTKIYEPREIDTLDECLFFVKKQNFKGFDDYGATWHFYAVEYSLRCTLANQKVMLFPLYVRHLSPGWSFNNSYWVTLIKVAKKYRKNFKVIPTTMGQWRTYRLLPLEIELRKIKRRIRGKKK